MYILVVANSTIYGDGFDPYADFSDNGDYSDGDGGGYGCGCGFGDGDGFGSGEMHGTLTGDGSGEGSVIEGLF